MDLLLPLYSHTNKISATTTEDPTSLRITWITMSNVAGCYLWNCFYQMKRTTISNNI